MATRRLGIIMNGVTGRMGTNQHLVRSIVAIRKEGGVKLPNGDRVMPDPILLGRNADKLAALAKEHGVERWSTDLDKALDNKDDELFFDAASTQLRPDLLKRAINKIARTKIYMKFSDLLRCKRVRTRHFHDRASIIDRAYSEGA